MADTPADAINVHAALRLGWLLAEVRGRARPGGPGADFTIDMARGGWALPLGSERSPAEREVEAEHSLVAVAKRLNLNWSFPTQAENSGAGAANSHDGSEHGVAQHNGPVEQPEGADGQVVAPPTLGPSPALTGVPATVTFSEELSRLGKLIAEQRRSDDSAAAATTWRQLAHLLYRWDARIQDELLSNSDSQANAYELGRALAEMYWALDPDAEAWIPHDQGTALNPVSWEFLFGDDRRVDISRLLGRLARYFAPLTPAAVAGSVEIWGRVAASEEWRRAGEARKDLLEQTRNWYSLLVADLDPQTMLKPYAGLRSWRIFKKAFRTFGLEMVTGTLGIAAIISLVLLLAYAPHQPALKAAAAVLGFLGVTGAGLQTRLKATTQSMAARLSVDLSTELVAEQITVTPPAPRSVKPGRTRQKAIESRTVTAPLGK
jgi:hypothetical protein